MIQDSGTSQKTKIKDFTDLNAWKEAHKLTVKIYEVTNEFPADEKYSLTSQIRRCSASVGANIAEGFGRQTYKEKAQFYYLAQGSLLELKNFLYIAKDVKYIDKK